MAAKPCKECGARPKMVGRHRCVVCHTRALPIGDQVAEAARRLAMVPEEMRRARVPERLWPTGTRWCSGCQSFVDLADVPKGSSRCRACASAAQHAARIEKVYGLTAAEYDALLEAQGGRCAICRGKPKSKRLAVDHNHKTGEVRGLLCSRCNHDLMGSAWDSLALAAALWHYLNTPPTGGEWMPPENRPPLGLSVALPADDGFDDPTPRGGGQGAQNGVERRVPDELDPAPAECSLYHYMPIGSESVPGKQGVWRYYVERDTGDPPF